MMNGRVTLQMNLKSYRCWPPTFQYLDLHVFSSEYLNQTESEIVINTLELSPNLLLEKN